jgi:hypothetical protein
MTAPHLFSHHVIYTSLKAVNKDFLHFNRPVASVLSMSKCYVEVLAARELEMQPKAVMVHRSETA